MASSHTWESIKLRVDIQETMLSSFMSHEATQPLSVSEKCSGVEHKMLKNGTKPYQSFLSAIGIWGRRLSAAIDMMEFRKRPHERNLTRTRMERPKDIFWGEVACYLYRCKLVRTMCTLPLVFTTLVIDIVLCPDGMSLQHHQYTLDILEHASMFDSTSLVRLRWTRRQRSPMMATLSATPLPNKTLPTPFSTSISPDPTSRMLSNRFVFTCLIPGSHT